jgi:formate dehydrogenase (NADP+) beta subunit
MHVGPGFSPDMRNAPLSSLRINIDGRDIEVKAGESILDTALAAGIYIPHLCHHPDLPSINACGLCIVEVEGSRSPVASCSTPPSEGMRVVTKTEQLDRLRKLALELLLSGHPQDCGTCNKYLNCELQSLKQYLTIENLKVKLRPKPFPIIRDNPLFVHDFSRCVLCGRCIRACHKLRGAGVLFYKKKGMESYVGTASDLPLAESGCKFCGSCAEVCPTGAIMDKEELVRGKNRKSALVPCKHACPAEIDVPRYIRFIRQRDYAAAVAVIRERVPFPAVLGYVCSHPCETACRRSLVNQAISIRDLKRYAAGCDGQDSRKDENKRPSTDKRVAIVGSGPAGLTAAYYLSYRGHGVTVFESLPSAGGMMRYGIPGYRLPRNVLDREIAWIEKTGVEILLNNRVESLDSLFENGFDAVLLALGTHEGQRLPLEGADAEGVWTGIEFMRNANREQSIQVGKRVVVFGGGNVAMDCARMAKRLGAEYVNVACIEDRAGMRADPEEIERAESEGIVIHTSKSLSRILNNNGKVTGTEFLDVDSFEFDENKNLQLESVEISQQYIEADTVIFAVGQRPEMPPDFRLDMRADRLIEAEPYSLQTSREGVFAAGDAVSGKGSLIDAIASGRIAAMAIDNYLGGSGIIDESLAPEAEPSAAIGSEKGFAALRRCRVHDMDGASAAEESLRCLQCDLRLKIKTVKIWSNY